MSVEVTIAVVGIADTVVGSVLGAAVGARLSSKAAPRTGCRRAPTHGGGGARPRVRAAAAFLYAEVEASRRRLQDAVTHGEWFSFYRLPTAAWDRHGPTLASRLTPDETAHVAHTFARSRDLDEAFLLLPTTRGIVVTRGDLRTLRLDRVPELGKNVAELRRLTAEALRILEPLARDGSGAAPRGWTSQ